MDMHGIATGAAFDVTAAVRQLAGQVVRLQVEVRALRAETGPGSADGPTPQVLPLLADGDLPEPVVEPVGLDLAVRLGHQRLVQALVGAGYTAVEQVQAATDETLLAVDGIGPVALAQIRQRLRD